MRKKGKQLKCLRNRTEEHEALLHMVRQFFAWQKLRKSIGNQIAAMLRGGLIDEDQAKEYGEGILKPYKKAEQAAIRQAGKKVATMPIWTQWLKDVRGVDKNLAAQFVALIQPISDFDNVAKLWSYAGQAVKDGRAVRREAGTQARWSADLKQSCFKFGDCVVKVGGPYRKVYDQYKARDKAKHPEPAPLLDAKGKPKKTRDGETWMQYTPMHLHRRATRYVAKLFLSHLWQVWRELEGLPVRSPYPIEALGHTTILSPWDFARQNDEPS